VGATGVKVVNRGVSASVREYFTAHPGVEVPLSELKSAIGKNVSNSVIHNAISYLRVRAEFPIETLAYGRIWRYRPAVVAKSTGKRMFEELAVTRTGDVLIQDEEGKVYRAVEL
jgi:hypothetical protein